MFDRYKCFGIKEVNIKFESIICYELMPLILGITFIYLVMRITMPKCILMKVIVNNIQYAKRILNNCNVLLINVYGM